MVIFLFGKVFDEVNMLAVSYVNCAGGFPAEFMEMFVWEVGAEFHFMEVVMLIVVDSLAGYGTESMIMAIAAFIKNFVLPVSSWTCFWSLQ